MLSSVNELDPAFRERVQAQARKILEVRETSRSRTNVRRRREVRVTEQFFDDLHDRLADEHGTNGEPSATYFLVMDLPAIVEKFAERFEELP